MLKALVIGCGSIGSDYDFDNDQILTHAKAYSNFKNISLCVADIDEKKAKSVAARYQVPYYTSLHADILRQFDIVSLCVNTKFHYEYLTTLVQLEVPFIICEKPVVSSLLEIEELKKQIGNENSILVNYIRRFQPGYKILKKRLVRFLRYDAVHQVIIRYQKGLLNNASHALDLLSFLFDEEVCFEKFQLISKEFDAFEYDPTVTASFLIGKLPVVLIGFTGVSYSIFEIDIYTSKWKISIEESGNTIRYFKLYKSDLHENNSMKQKDVLKDYMMPVMQQAFRCMKGKEKTNFNAALNINEQILKVLEKIK